VLYLIAGFAGRSATATHKRFQEHGETFRDGVVDRIVLCPEALPAAARGFGPVSEIRFCKRGSLNVRFAESDRIAASP
jgi:hypothetical protein